MTSPHETAYPRLKSDPTPKELRELYTPTEAELAFVAGLAKRPLARVAVLMHLKLFQRLGYFSPLADTPEAIRDHIATNSNVARCPSFTELKRFDTSGTRQRLAKPLREYLQVRPLDEKGLAWLAHVAETAADTRYMLPDIINVMLEELVHHRYELPAFSTLDRIAVQARGKNNDQHFSAITQQLSPQAKVLIDALLKADPEDRVSGWQLLKREPKKPTNKETRSYLLHIRRLQQLVELVPKPDIPIPKLRQYRFQAQALDVSEMAELKPLKRYALSVIFIRSQYAKTLDDATDLFIRLIQNMENLARQKLLQHQQERTQRTDFLVEQLRDVLTAYKTDGTDTQRVDAIEGSLIADIEALLQECEEHLAYAGRNYLPFLLGPYKAVRAQLLNCIQIVSPKASSEDPIIEKMIRVLEALRSNRHDQVSLSALELNPDIDFDWMSTQWKKLVLQRSSGKGKPDMADRRFLELAILFEIKDQLKSGDLYVKHGERYDDYREQLVDDATFEKEVEEYGTVTGLDIHPASFVSSLRQEMLELADAVDKSFPHNLHAEIVNGRLVLKKPARSETPEGIAKLDRLVNERLESLSILDVLIDTERWLELHRQFKTLAGNESKVEDLRKRVITTVFCYGCNLGPTQTAKSIKGINRRQVAWLNLKSITEDVLDKAIVKVINAYNKFELPGYWGSGEHASADGTKWNLYEQNLLSEYHIRYGGYGGIGYYHVSDKMIALFSHFISCGTYEGIHILDGLVANESDIKPGIVHGDTQAQSYPVFALAHLLGIKLMPRIRGIPSLVFHRPDGKVTYEAINSLFSETIDWKMIETHLPDMLRVVVSIKLGKITPSAILRRLGTHSRRNKVYFAFRELGKVIRTMFLLRYISDVDMRKMIHAETNKSEQFNQFAKALMFGGGGIIAENLRHEQRKIVKYNHLVANMVILHNVVRMTKILTELRLEGVEVTQEMLAGLKPYRLESINRFGDYVIDIRRKVIPMIFDTKIIV